MGGNEMKVTVDTHVLIWRALKPEMLSKKAMDAISIANETDSIICSDISLWEISMLMSKNRIHVESTYLEFIKLIKASTNYFFQRITPEIADVSTRLPAEINLDPADRIICATSLISNTPLVTADANLRKSGIVKTIW
jgi:PIN domain nuclease of toxin-antitoxin system